MIKITNPQCMVGLGQFLTTPHTRFPPRASAGLQWLASAALECKKGKKGKNLTETILMLLLFIQIFVPLY